MATFPVSAQAVIPQKEPIILIDEILDCNDILTITNYLIKKGSIFIENGKLQAAGIMENIAQSCAARTGLRKNMGTNGNPVQIGVIGAVKNFTIHQLPCEGDTLTTTITEIADLYPALVVNAEVVCQSQPIATAEMKVFIIEKQ